MDELLKCQLALKFSTVELKPENMADYWKTVSTSLSGCSIDTLDRNTLACKRQQYGARIGFG
jgi:hypothetical protein